MNCREHQHDIVLFLYDELSDTERAGLRAHLDECEGCRQFHEDEKQLHLRLTDDFSDWQIPSDLLVESRRLLSEEMDRVDARRSWWRVPSIASAFAFFSRTRLLESAALLSVGLAVGVFVTAQRPFDTTEPAGTAQGIVASIPQNAAVSNLRIIEADAATGRVQLAGEMVQPMRMEGSLQDAEVRNLLFSALKSPSNPGFRLRAVELLSQAPRDPSVKEVLLGTLLHDDNAGVRLYALEGLRAFAADEDVRRALVYVIENDENPGLRVQAIETLMPLTDEELGRELLESTREDQNPFVRMKALQFVGTGRQ